MRAPNADEKAQTRELLHLNERIVRQTSRGAHRPPPVSLFSTVEPRAKDTRTERKIEGERWTENREETNAARHFSSVAAARKKDPLEHHTIQGQSTRTRDLTQIDDSSLPIANLT